MLCRVILRYCLTGCAYIGHICGARHVLLAHACCSAHAAHRHTRSASRDFFAWPNNHLCTPAILLYRMPWLTCLTLQELNCLIFPVIVANCAGYVDQLPCFMLPTLDIQQLRRFCSKASQLLDCHLALAVLFNVLLAP